MIQILLFVLCAIVAEILGTVGGFGSSVFFVPIAQFFYDFQTVLAMTGLLHVFSNASKLFLFRKNVDYALLLLIGIPGVIMVIIGAELSAYLDLSYTELVLGIFLVIFTLFVFVVPDFKILPTKFNSITAGGIAGLLAGFVGTGGVIRGMSLAAFNLHKNTFIATSAAIDMGVDLSRSIIYLRHDYLEPKYYYQIPFLLVAAYAGSYIGKIILDKISHETFRRIVLLLLLLVGISLIIKFIINTL